MNKKTVVTLALGVCLAVAASASADAFATFTMDFVPISGDASSANGTPWGTSGDTFSDPDDFRMATYEVTDAQWDAFVADAGAPTGTPAIAFDQNPTATGPNKPVNYISFFEAVQFVNYLNTSTGNQAAYNIVGGVFGVWSPTEADGTNLYRHKDAMYFLPTFHEVIKAAYWNGAALQNWANATDTAPTAAESCFSAGAPWDVGSGAIELNGTFDMMGNIGEVQENDVNFLYPSATHMHRLGPGIYMTPNSFGQYASPGWTGLNNNQSAETVYGGLRVAAGAVATTGDFDGDGNADAIDIDLLADAIRTGSINFGLFDISVDGTTGGTDGNIDINDLDYLVRFLVDTTMGVGTGSEYGDFSLDGLIDTTDLTRLATNFGPGSTWAEGNANRYIDLTIDTTDLTILGTYFGFDASVDTIPEPATLFVMGCGAVGLLRRRRS